MKFHLAALIAASIVLSSPLNSAEVIEPLQPYVAKVSGSLNEIPAERKAKLRAAIDYITKKVKGEGTVKLNFICTHNSRRSHLSQVWSQVAAHHYDVKGVETFSGGTESTACNIRTVRVLRRTGLAIVASSGGENPVYLIQFSEKKLPMKAFSKIYSEDGNPKEGFAAMMCCADCQ